MNARSLGRISLMVVFRNPTIYFLFVLLLAACSSSSSTLSTPTAPPVQSSSQTEAANHPPVILRVVERMERVNGQLVIHKDIYFTDSEGDAITLVNKLVSTAPAGIPVTVLDDVITVSADKQKYEGLVTSTAGPSFALAPFSITIEDRILDNAGNFSEPVLVTFSFMEQSPNSIPYLIAGFLMVVGLLVGFWLLPLRHLSDGRSAFRSILFLFCSLFPISFFGAILHEGGHALAVMMWGGTIYRYYVHPFSFSGFVANNTEVLFALNGFLPYALPVLLPLTIFILLWKRRSIATFPLLLLFPHLALVESLQLISLDHDVQNMMQPTELPGLLFIGIGVILLIFGTAFYISLFPLIGLEPDNRKTLLVVPIALFIYSALGMLVAYSLVPGSAADLNYLRGYFILRASNQAFILFPFIGMILAAIYVTFYSRIHLKLPAWLQTETVNLSWKDLRIPALLAVISVILGLTIII